MAMKVTANSPSTGYIAWTGTSISYKGQTYTISDGNTNFIYVYWLYSNPTTFYGSNTYPTLGADDILVFVNKMGVPLTVPNTTVIDGSLVVPQSITANAIAANTISATQIAAGAITASALAAGAVTATTVAAGAIGTTALAAGAVVADKIATGTITANQIATGTITSNELASNSVIAGKIATNAITAGTIAANAVTAGTIAAGAVTATQIASNTITATQIASGAITSNELSSNSVIAGKIATNAITAGTIAANAVTAGTVAANAIGATQVAANAITADKIAIGDFSNLATANEVLGTTTSQYAGGETIVSGGYLKKKSSTQGYLMLCDYTANPFKSGDEVYFEFEGLSPSTTKTATLSIWCYDANKSYITSNSAATITLTSSNAKYTGSLKLTNAAFDSAAYVLIGLSGLASNDLSVRRAFVRRKNDGSLIVDGSVTANTIATGVITANKLAAGTITAASGVIGSIDASKITTGTLSAINISGAVISAGDTTGQVHFDDNGWYVKNSAGVPQIGVFMNNTIIAEPSASQLQWLDHTGANSMGMMGMAGGTNNDDYLQILSNTSINITFAGNLLLGGSGIIQIGSDIDAQNHNLKNANHITIADVGAGEGLEWLGGSGWIIHETDDAATANNAAEPLQFFTGGKSGTRRVTFGTTGNIYNTGTDVHIQNTSAANFTSDAAYTNLTAAASTAANFYVGSDGTARIYSIDIYNRTYSSGATVTVTAAGTLGRISSASKYKLNIQDINADLPEKILQVSPKQWFDKAASERLAEYETLQTGVHVDGTPLTDEEKEQFATMEVPYVEPIGGLIAEDLIAAGLDRFVLYGAPDENSVRQPEGIQYDRLWTLLIPIIRDLKARVETLEAATQATDTTTAQTTTP